MCICLWARRLRTEQLHQQGISIPGVHGRASEHHHVPRLHEELLEECSESVPYVGSIVRPDIRHLFIWGHDIPIEMKLGVYLLRYELSYSGGIMARCSPLHDAPEDGPLVALHIDLEVIRPSGSAGHSVEFVEISVHLPVLGIPVGV